jgi:hypothetical protein
MLPTEPHTFQLTRCSFNLNQSTGEENHLFYQGISFCRNTQEMNLRI